MAASEIKPTHPEDVHPPVPGGGGSQTSLGGSADFVGAMSVPLEMSGNPASIGSSTIDADGEKIALVFQVPRSGTLDGCEFRVGAITNAPDNPLRASFQDVSTATGDPDGVQDQFRDFTPVANTWTNPGLMTSDGTDNGSKRAVTKGQLLAVVVEFTTFVALDSVNLATQFGATYIVHNGLTYQDTFTAAWVKGGGTPMFTLKYSDGTYSSPLGCIGANGGTNHTISNATTPDEVALRFVPPVSLTVVGAWFDLDFDGDADFVLYDAGGVVLATVSSTAAIRPTTSVGLTRLLFGSDIVLTAGAVYRLAIKPTTATTLTTQSALFPSAAVLAGVPLGDRAILSTRVDGGVWTDDSTRRLLVGFYVSKVNS